jgi:16S rRNA processing protein RimM
VDWLEIGVIVAAQGLRGELRVKPLTDFPERLTQKGKRRLISPKGQILEVLLANGRLVPGKSLFICQFAEIGDRNAVDEWIGATISIQGGTRPHLAEGEFWLPDLQGMAVHRQDTDEKIGEIRDLVRSGNDLLVVQLNNGKQIYIPFVPDLVPTVDLEAQKVVINPIPGLLDPDQADS